MTARSAPSRGAVLGTVFGASAWALALGVVCAVAGVPDLTWSLALPAFVASCALGLLVSLAYVQARRVGPPDAATPLLALLGGVFTALGVLLLLARTWILPALDAAPEVAALLDAAGSARSVPAALPIVALAAGSLLLLAALARHDPRA